MRVCSGASATVPMSPVDDSTRRLPGLDGQSERGGQVVVVSDGESSVALVGVGLDSDLVVESEGDAIRWTARRPLPSIEIFTPSR